MAPTPLLALFGDMALATDSTIVLDPRIRDWVLLPIFFVMIMQGIMRQFLSVMLKDPSPSKVVDLDDIRRTSSLQRAALLRAHGQFIPASAFQMRKHYLLNKVLLTPEGESDPMANPAMQDPFMMVNMMKQHLALIVPNMILMGWVSYFFPGFVIMKLPFGATEGFRAMLQRGINLSSLDVSYVSSLSWYFLNFFGLRGLMSLLLGKNNVVDDTRLMQQQMKPTNAMQPQDPKKLIIAERNELEITSHEDCISAAEERLLGM